LASVVLRVVAHDPSGHHAGRRDVGLDDHRSVARNVGERHRRTLPHLAGAGGRTGRLAARVPPVHPAGERRAGADLQPLGPLGNHLEPLAAPDPADDRGVGAGFRADVERLRGDQHGDRRGDGGRRLRHDRRRQLRRGRRRGTTGREHDERDGERRER
jgi:hypothetical protein